MNLKSCISFGNNSILNPSGSKSLRLVAIYDQMQDDVMYFCGEKRHLISAFSQYFNRHRISVAGYKSQGNFTNGTWTQLIGSIVNDEADVSVSTVINIINHSGLNLVRFSPPMGIGNSIGLLKSKLGDREASLFSIFDCFDLYIWVFLVIICLIFFLFNFFTRNFTTTNKLIGFVLITLFSQSTGKIKFKNFSLLISLWLLVTTILVLYYKTVLLSNMVWIEPSKIKSFQDLANKPQIQIIGFKGGSSYKMICASKNTAFIKICKRTKGVTEYLPQHFINVITRKAVMFAAKTWIDHLARGYPGLMIHTIRDDTYFRSPSFIYNQKLSMKMRDKIDLLFYKLVEMGLCEIWFNEGRAKRINLKSFQFSHLHKLELDFPKFKGTLYLYFVFILFSILVFIFEILLFTS